MFRKNRFYFLRVDVEAADNNNICYAVKNFDVAVRVYLHVVSCVEPAVYETFTGEFFLMVIAFSNRRAARP